MMLDARSSFASVAFIVSGRRPCQSPLTFSRADFLRVLLKRSLKSVTLSYPVAFSLTSMAPFLEVVGRASALSVLWRLPCGGQ